MTNSPPTFDDIQSLAETVAGAGLRSISMHSESLSARTGASIHLKLESLQPTGSFKVRGALVKLMSLSDSQRQKGVVAMSAGNHAQGVAYHGGKMGIPVTIVMPRATPFTKVVRTEALGAKVILEGDSLAGAAAHAGKLASDGGLYLVHPYDDPEIVTGQGTIGIELLEDHPELEVVVVPIGGGGLAAGLALAAKTIKPGIEIIGVEAALYPSMRNVIKGETTASGGITLADGIAVQSPGTLTQKLIGEHVDDILTVEESSIEAAMHMFLIEQRIFVEGAGAVGLAAVLDHPELFAGRNVGLIVSGGNTDARLMSSVLMRGLVRGNRLVRMRVGAADTAGALADLTGEIGDGGGNILEVYHQRWFSDVAAGAVEIDVVVETRDSAHVQRLLQRLRDAGYSALLLSNSVATEEGQIQ